MTEQLPLKQEKPTSIGSFAEALRNLFQGIRERFTKRLKEQEENSEDERFPLLPHPRSQEEALFKNKTIRIAARTTAIRKIPMTFLTRIHREPEAAELLKGIAEYERTHQVSPKELLDNACFFIRFTNDDEEGATEAIHKALGNNVSHHYERSQMEIVMDLVLTLPGALRDKIEEYIKVKEALVKELFSKTPQEALQILRAINIHIKESEYYTEDNRQDVVRWMALAEAKTQDIKKTA
jgi:hypothetical protein